MWWLVGKIGTWAQGRMCAQLQSHGQARRQPGTALALPFNLLDQKYSHITSRGTHRYLLPRRQAGPLHEPSGILTHGQACTARQGAEDTGSDFPGPAACPVVVACWDQPCSGPDTCVVDQGADFSALPQALP